MSVIRPFSAVRPKKEYASSVAALPYDVMSSDEAREKVKNSPLSFIHVDKAEVDLPEDINIYSDEVYAKAAENLRSLSDKGVCFREKSPKLYIYRQTMGSVCQTGIVGCASVDDYINGVIKRHENTREEKERDRIRHVDTCNANTGPIFLAYRRNPTVDAVIKKYTAREREYDFVSEGSVRNEVWVIDDPADISAVEAGFGEVRNLYIADGHHRAASAVKVGLKRREKHPGYTGDEEFNFFLAVCFVSDELKILDYNRLISAEAVPDEKTLFEKLSADFEIRKKTAAFAPEKRHSFGMYYKNTWYSLELKEGRCNEADVLGSLDVSILQNYVIGPVFGIDDPRTDKRIDFVGGIRGLKELEKRCGEDMALAFSMYPTSLDELMSIADGGLIMPPKSTWFEPKLLSGLFIHELDG